MYVCSGCHRHVRETTCPFCGAAQTGAPLAGPSAVRIGMKRSAVLVAVAAAAMSSTGTVACGGKVATEVIAPAPEYGIAVTVESDASPPDGEDSGAPPDAAPDVPAMGSAYGIAVFIDSGNGAQDASDASDDVVAPAAEYGIPGTVDAGDQ
jgi:hypothetical protein